MIGSHGLCEAKSNFQRMTLIERWALFFCLFQERIYFFFERKSDTPKMRMDLTFAGNPGRLLYVVRKQVAEGYEGQEKEMTEFKDGSKIEDGAFVGETAIDVFALIQAKHWLAFEIKTGMKMSRYLTALQGAENISGLTFGRGVKGRQKALEWVEAELARIHAEEVVA